MRIEYPPGHRTSITEEAEMTGKGIWEALAKTYIESAKKNKTQIDKYFPNVNVTAQIGKSACGLNAQVLPISVDSGFGNLRSFSVLFKEGEKTVSAIASAQVNCIGHFVITTAETIRIIDESLGLTEEVVYGMLKSIGIFFESPDERIKNQ